MKEATNTTSTSAKAVSTLGPPLFLLVLLLSIFRLGFTIKAESHLYFTWLSKFGKKKQDSYEQARTMLIDTGAFLSAHLHRPKFQLRFLFEEVQHTTVPKGFWKCEDILILQGCTIAKVSRRRRNDRKILELPERMPATTYNKNTPVLFSFFPQMFVSKICLFFSLENKEGFVRTPTMISGLRVRAKQSALCFWFPAKSLSPCCLVKCWLRKSIPLQEKQTNKSYTGLFFAKTRLERFNLFVISTIFLPFLVNLEPGQLNGQFWAHCTNGHRDKFRCCRRFTTEVDHQKTSWGDILINFGKIEQCPCQG